jgi:hypothetical protein
MPRVVFEPKIPVFQRTKTVHALDRAERMWKEVGVAYFQALARNLSGGTEENEEQYHSRQLVHRPPF